MKPSLEPADDDKYSQLAPLAVIALLLGIASLLALIGPLFFLVPAAAIGFALLATQLLKVVGLLEAGGLMLLWVSWKLLRELREQDRAPGDFSDAEVAEEAVKHPKSCLLYTSPSPRD